MKSRHWLKTGVSILFFLYAMPSFATMIVEGNFKAEVAQYDIIGNHSDFGSPAIGTEISATFSYLVERNITGPIEEPNMATYSEGPNWINFNFNIGGLNYTIAPNPETPTQSSLIVQKMTPDSWGDFLDMFYMTESYETYSPSMSDPSYVNRSARVLVWGGMDDIGAIQDFSITDADTSAYIYLDSSGFNNGSYYETLFANIKEFNITSRSVEVPEPSGLLLSSIGFLFLGWRLFQSSKIKT